MFATQGYLGQSVLILFTIGIIAAAFSNSDSALTAMTTSVCIDLLNTDKDTEETARRKRKKVHLSLSILLAFFICLVEMLNNKSVIDAIYIIASYTYGPCWVCSPSDCSPGAGLRTGWSRSSPSPLRCSATLWTGG